MGRVCAGRLDDVLSFAFAMPEDKKETRTTGLEGLNVAVLDPISPACCAWPPWLGWLCGGGYGGVDGRVTGDKNEMVRNGEEY